MCVALCTYNGGAYLREQLASITAQTRLPDALVVRDDGSTDETVATLTEFARSAPFPVDVEQNRGRLGVARNFEGAIAACSGDVIVLSDQDDVWLPHKLERLHALFDTRADVGVAFSDALAVDARLQPLGYRAWETLSIDAETIARLRGSQALPLLLARPVVSGSVMAFASRLREIVLPFPAFVGDGVGGWMLHDRWIAVLGAAATAVEPVAEVLSQYRQHERQELGLAAPAPGGWGSTHAHDQELQLMMLDVVIARLALFSGEPWARRAEADAVAFRDHLATRTALSRRRLARVPSVARELASGRYRRYSRGVVSAVKDVALRAPQERSEATR